MTAQNLYFVRVSILGTMLVNSVFNASGATDGPMDIVGLLVQPLYVEIVLKKAKKLTF